MMNVQKIVLKFQSDKCLQRVMKFHCMDALYQNDYQLSIIELHHHVEFS